MRKILIAFACIALAACSHIPLVSKQPVTGSVVGVVEYETGLTKFSTVTGMYHQDMCSKENGDVPVHLSDKEMKNILAAADKSGFYNAPTDLTTNWTDSPGRPPHCANFRLRIESGTQHNEVRWDCGTGASNAPPAQVASLVQQIQQVLHSRKEVRAMAWSSCSVR